MRSLFQDLRAGQKERCETLWRHSFLTACLCRRLNTVLGLGCQGEEFSGGLFHDLGRLLITLGVPDRAAAIDPLHFREADDVLGRERERLGVDHGYFGAWFANVNQLPAALANASLFHHAPEETHEYQTLVALVATADHLANYVQREKKTDGYTPDGNRGWPLLGVAQDEKVRARLATLLPGYLAES